MLSNIITYGRAKVHEPMQRRAEVGDIKNKPAFLRGLATTEMNGVAEMKKLNTAIGGYSVLHMQKGASIWLRKTQ